MKGKAALAVFLFMGGLEQGFCISRTGFRIRSKVAINAATVVPKAPGPQAVPVPAGGQQYIEVQGQVPTSNGQGGAPTAMLYGPIEGIPAPTSGRNYVIVQTPPLQQQQQQQQQQQVPFVAANTQGGQNTYLIPGPATAVNANGQPVNVQMQQQQIPGAVAAGGGGGVVGVPQQQQQGATVAADGSVVQDGNTIPTVNGGDKEGCIKRQVCRWIIVAVAMISIASLLVAIVFTFLKPKSPRGAVQHSTESEESSASN